MPLMIARADNREVTYPHDKMERDRLTVRTMSDEIVVSELRGISRVLSRYVLSSSHGICQVEYRAKSDYPATIRWSLPNMPSDVRNWQRRSGWGRRERRRPQRRASANNQSTEIRTGSSACSAVSQTFLSRQNQSDVGITRLTMKNGNSLLIASSAASRRNGTAT